MTGTRTLTLLLGLYLSTASSAIAADELTGPLQFGVAPVVPMGLATASNRFQIGAELERVKTELPRASVVGFLFDVRTSHRADWLSALDLCSEKKLKAFVSFGEIQNGNERIYRPTLRYGQWQFSKLGTFVADPECISHPALHAVYLVDEPWHETKLPVYSGDDLKAMYAALKARAPAGVSFKIMLQFSRELWKIVHDRKVPGLYWDRGMADIVQISALELQSSTYQHELLHRNHYWSRSIIHEKTPGIPLWTSVQVFGARYGPNPGYWFPRERDGYHDLRRMLDDVTSDEYEAQHPLRGIMFQAWDSSSVERRPSQYTLGDRDAGGTPLPQREAAADALDAIRRWLDERLASFDR